MITIRMERVNSEVQKGLTEIVRNRMKDSRLKEAIITILKAEVTKDMKNCKAYVSVMPSSKGKDIVKLLNSCESFIRRNLIEIVKLRNAPSIRFVLDDSADYYERIDNLIKEIHKNDAEKKVIEDQNEENE